MNAPVEEKKDEMNLDGGIPGLAEDAVVEGGVDAAKDDDNCPSGACKI